MYIYMLLNAPIVHCSSTGDAPSPRATCPSRTAGQCADLCASSTCSSAFVLLTTATERACDQIIIRARP